MEEIKPNCLDGESPTLIDTAHIAHTPKFSGRSHSVNLTIFFIIYPGKFKSHLIVKFHYYVFKIHSKSISKIDKRFIQDRVKHLE